MATKTKYVEHEQAEKSAGLAWSALKRNLKKAGEGVKVVAGDIAAAARDANANTLEKEQAASFRETLLIDTNKAVKQFTIKLQVSQGIKCSADSALLGVLEQMLLHVVKNSRPASIFKKDPQNAQLLWEFLVATSSITVIQQVEKEILSNSGSWAQRCRIWMRLALDDVDLFAAAVADRDAVAKHYGAEAFMTDPEMPEMAAAMLRSVVTMANVARPGADGSAPAAIVVASPFPHTDAGMSAGQVPPGAAVTGAPQTNDAASIAAAETAASGARTSPPLQQQPQQQQHDIPARVAAPLVVHKKKKKKKHKKSKSDATQPEVEAAKAELLKTLGLDDEFTSSLQAAHHHHHHHHHQASPASAATAAAATPVMSTTPSSNPAVSIATASPPAAASPPPATAPPAPALMQVRLVPEAVGTVTARGEDSVVSRLLPQAHLLQSAAPPLPPNHVESEFAPTPASEPAPGPALTPLLPVAGATSPTSTAAAGHPTPDIADFASPTAPSLGSRDKPTTPSAPPPSSSERHLSSLPSAAASLSSTDAPDAVAMPSSMPVALEGDASAAAATAAPSRPEAEVEAALSRQVSDDTAAMLQTHGQILSGKAGRADRMAAALAALDGHLSTAEVETVAIAKTVSSNPPQGSPSTARARMAASSFSAIRKEQMDKVAEQRKQDESIAREAVSHEVMIKVGSSRHQVWKTLELEERDLHVDSTPQNPQLSSEKATFETKVVGTTLTVSRTDRKIGWSQPLVLKATRGAVVPLPADLTSYSGPSPLEKEAHGWKARAGRADGPDSYKFGDLTRSTVAGGKKLMHDVTGGIASALSKVVHAGSGGRRGLGGGGDAGAASVAGGSGGGPAAASGGGGDGYSENDGDSDGFDDFELLTDMPSGSGDGVVSLIYDEQSSLEMLGKITLLRPVMDLETDQMCECAHCKSKIPIIDPENKTEFARRCEYDGKWYCEDCHVNNEAVIPAVVLHHGDATPQPVSRRAKQFLGLVDTEPVLMLEMIEYEAMPGSQEASEGSPHSPPPPPAVLAKLAKLEKALKRISGVRTSLKSLKDRMLQDPRVNATELRQKLWPREHLWDDTSLWTMQDLREVATHLQVKSDDSMVPLERKLRDLVIQFQKHIAKQKGKGAMIKRW